MAFTKKEWKDRVSAYPTRRKLLDASNNETIVTVSRYEGEVTEDGDAFSAENMNDLEDRIEDGFNSIPEPVVDSDFSGTSTNPVQNKTVKAAIDRLDSSKAASSHTHGNIQNGGTLQSSDVAIANGDKLVVTDASNSNKVARTSLSFDGSTTTQFLSKKGTWVTLTDYFGINGKNVLSTVYQNSDWGWTATQDAVIVPYQMASNVTLDGVVIWSGDTGKPGYIPVRKGQSVGFGGGGLNWFRVFAAK